MTSPAPSRLLLGTGNPGKLRELKALFGPLGLKLATPLDLGLELKVEETGEDYASNARLKALTYAQASGLWTIADDTGLEVEALDGAPGLYSARLAGADGNDEDRRKRLLQLLDPEPQPWPARFVCTMALASPGEVLAVTTGQCSGRIVTEPRGQGGFGYDPIFQVEGEGQAMAQLPLERKNQISHRARAARAMTLRLQRYLEQGA